VAVEEMKKSVQEFYTELSDLLRKEHLDLLGAFNNHAINDNPKQVFLWLQSELEKRNISDELNEIITDFFYSIH
jgi:hypothetical protein